MMNLTKVINKRAFTGTPSMHVNMLGPHGSICFLTNLALTLSFHKSSPVTTRHQHIFPFVYLNKDIVEVLYHARYATIHILTFSTQKMSKMVFHIFNISGIQHLLKFKTKQVSR